MVLHKHQRTIDLKIVSENENYIVLHKAAGIATQTARLGEQDLVSEVKNYLADNGHEKNPYIAVINRLDQPVEGLVLMAKDEKTAALLSRQLTQSEIEKYYQARVYGHMPSESGTLEDWIKKDAKTNLSVISVKDDKQAKKAVLEYRVISGDEKTDTLDIHLLTGRHHQIRLQLSHAGCPLIGDRKYTSADSKAYSEAAGIKNICLKAYKLVFTDPSNKKRIELTL